MERKHAPVTVSYQSDTIVSGGAYNGAGSDVYICGMNGWVSMW